MVGVSPWRLVWTLCGISSVRSSTGVRPLLTGAESQVRLPLGYAIWLCLTVGCADSLAPQAVPRLHLSAQFQRHPEEFNRVSSVRELADGRVLVADRRERLVVLDWQSGTAAEISRKGEGPGEYVAIGRLYALRGDSTLFTAGSPRWLLIHGARVVRTVTGPIAGYQTSGEIEGLDTSGHVLDVQPRNPWLRRSVDSLALILGDSGTRRADTLARLKGGGRNGYAELVRPGRHRTIFYMNPLATEEQAILFSDGWVAVARVDPYRVDWRAPTGAWRRGQPLPHQTVPVSQEEKCFALDQWAGEAGWCDQADALPAWPRFLPALPHPWPPHPILLALPDGRLAVRRTTSTRSSAVSYDIVDRAGRLVAILDIPVRDRLLAFGTRSVYVLEMDEDHVQTLRRHSWP